MAKKIDYYDYWSSKKKENHPVIKSREKKALNLIIPLMHDNISILDIGCGDGSFMQELKKVKENSNIFGIEYSDREIEEARKKGLDVRKMDVEQGIDFQGNGFEIVYAGEVIEHIFNPDNFLAEINRILKRGGHLLITTPNLCAWFNRILFPFGVQPIFLEPSTKSKLVGSGFLGKLKKDNHPVGHIRVFTFQALKDLLEMNGFKIEKVKGASYEEGFPKKLIFIDRMMTWISPKLAGHFVILAKKVK